MRSSTILIAVLFLIALVAQSQEPVPPVGQGEPTPGVPERSSESDVAPANDGAEAQDPATPLGPQQEPVDTNTASGDAGAENSELRAPAGEEAITTYTLWLTVFTGLLALSTLLLWWETKKSAKVASKSAQIAERALDFSERPWLQVDATGGLREPKNTSAFKPEEPDDRLLTIGLSIRLRNLGKSPAIVESYSVCFPDFDQPVETWQTYHPLVPGEAMLLASHGLPQKYLEIAESPIAVAYVTLTRANRDAVIMSNPRAAGWVRYRTPHNKVMEVGFSFALRPFWGNNWERRGGKNDNYEREVSD